MSYKRIAVDIDTYTKLKNNAQNSGRTIVGEIRYLLRSDAPTPVYRSVSSATSQVEDADYDDKQAKLQQMQNRLQYFDEDSEEYQEALDEIQQLMAE